MRLTTPRRQCGIKREAGEVSAPGLPLVKHLQRLGDAPATSLLALGLCHPPRELLTVGVSEHVERLAGPWVGVEGRCQRMGDRNRARLGVELKREGDGVARRDSGLLPSGAAETEEVLATHLRDRSPQHGAVDRGAGGKALGALAHDYRISPTTVALTLETDTRDQFTFLPGQYVNIAVPGTDEHRSYLFANGPEEQQLRFLIKLATGGVMSQYLIDRAAVGDEVSFTGPNGSFFLRESERPLLLLAGGTVLAPILSIMRRLRATGSTRPAHLPYGLLRTRTWSSWTPSNTSPPRSGR